MLGPTVGQARRRRRPWWRAPLLRVATLVAPPLIALALRVLHWTLRVEFVNAAGLMGRWSNGDRVIMTFWHNRMVAMPIPTAGVPISILVSRHRDGEIATRVLRHWGIRAVRGSATRGAVPGFLRLVDAFRADFNLAVVPDGPRGPRYVAKPGVIRLAKATGADVYPVSFAASRVWQLRSWDRLIIPKPFSRVVFEVGNVLRVAPDAEADELERQREGAEKQLNELSRSAEARCGVVLE
jgi:lysophospholipid acyltransferase (LPLAT)-like uncharacterized protein